MLDGGAGEHQRVAAQNVINIGALLGQHIDADQVGGGAVEVGVDLGSVDEQHLREAKLAEHGLSFGDAERIHQRVADELRYASTQFAKLQALLGLRADNGNPLSFQGILWPEFDFTATADSDGSIAAAEYRRARGEPVCAAAPTIQPPWSMDTVDFAHCFGPAKVISTSVLFDKYLPAQELHEFDWEGRRYGAGFGWGLFLSASRMWT